MRVDAIRTDRPIFKSENLPPKSSATMEAINEINKLCNPCLFQRSCRSFASWRYINFPNPKGEVVEVDGYYLGTEKCAVTKNLNTGSFSMPTSSGDINFTIVRRT